MKNLQIRVEGKVQHIGFRFIAMQKAYQYGVRGIVKNMKDGSLYIEAEGDDESLDIFSAWCKKGPMSAKVSNIEIQEGDFKNYQSFDIK